MGCGVYDPSLIKEYSGHSWTVDFHKRLADPNFLEAKKNDGFIFAIGNDCFIFSPINVFVWSAKCTDSLDEFSKFVNALIDQEKQRKESLEKAADKKESDDPLKSHMKGVIERLERIASVTRKDPAGWNYLEKPLHKIESDINTLKGWLASGMDAHRIAIYNNLCKEYDCRVIE